MTRGLEIKYRVSPSVSEIRIIKFAVNANSGDSGDNISKYQ